MSFDLFQRRPLVDDTAQLKERWAQEGSEYFLVQERVDIDTSETTHTLRNGDIRFVDYVSDVIVTVIETNSTNCFAWLGGGATNHKLFMDLKGIGVGNTAQFQLKVPIKMVNTFGQGMNIVIFAGNTASQSDYVLDITLIGWRESA